MKREKIPKIFIYWLICVLESQKLVTQKKTYVIIVVCETKKRIEIAVVDLS